MTTVAGRQDQQGLAVKTSPMKGDASDLLDIAVKAHGGLARWNKVSSVTIDASTTGASGT
jgi:hypothetical protein